MFSFGYVYQHAYANKPTGFGFGKIFPILLAFYFSALTWKVLINHQLSIKSFLAILLLLRVPPYSEFLLTFFLAGLVFFIFKKQMAFIILNGKNMLWVIFGLLLLSLLPFLNIYPTVTLFGKPVQLDFYIGLVLGSSDSYFPLVSYFIFFILGMWFQKNKTGFSKTIALVSLTGTLIFIIYFILFNKAPKRFPPSPVWTIGSLAFVYGYFLLSRKIKSRLLHPFLNTVGENSLIYLLLSNVLIFAAANIPGRTIAGAIIGAVFIIVFTTYLISISRKIATAKESGGIN